jgi:hypothetical protein
MINNAKIDGLTVAKHKLSQIISDDEITTNFPGLGEDCLSALLKIEKQIMKLREPESVSHDKNKLKHTGD